MAEAIALDYSQLEGCGNVYEAALQCATQHSVPTWNGWTSLVAQLRRYYPDDPAHSELQGSSAITAWSRELFHEVMEQVHGPGWEPASRPSAVRPRRPPRASYVAGARSGGLVASLVSSIDRRVRYPLALRLRWRQQQFLVKSGRPMLRVMDTLSQYQTPSKGSRQELGGGWGRLSCSHGCCQ